MTDEFNALSGHSAEHFGDARDHWWNRDFLQLIAKRWKFDTARNVLDVGCGVGHWAMVLAAVLHRDARVTGVDPEPNWVRLAAARAADAGLAERFEYRKGAAENLPFPDDSFDLTTCQTVLIHTSDPSAALTEMRRVTRPGGLVVVAEPNNVSGALMMDSLASQTSTEELVELVRFQLTCERGKVALGEGDNSLGERVAGLFVAAGLLDVDVYVNDKACVIHPPYATAEQRAFVTDVRARDEQNRWIWDERETRRFFLAGGGKEPEFAAHFARGLEAGRRMVRSLDAQTYHGIAGGAFYLVAGRKS